MAGEADQPGAPPGEQDPGAQPSEEELRARFEEELRKVRVQDLLLQSVASLVNLTARRIAKDDERDLEQARIGIEAVKALAELLDPEPREQVRSALSELQMLYAQTARGAAGGEDDDPGEGGGEAAAGPAKPDPAPGAAGAPRPDAPERPSGLWTPRGTSSS